MSARRVLIALLLVGITAGATFTCTSQTAANDDCSAVIQQDGGLTPLAANTLQMLDQGQQIFRFDTFGSEAFWGDQLQLHRAIAGSAQGGVDAGVSPRRALELGLKVDSEALPEPLLTDLREGRVDLDNPATTIELLRGNAVVGVTGFFGADGGFTGIGIQCALCHSTVDDLVAPGIGRRLDGWANRDLNIGAIIASAPNLTPYTELLGVDDATVRRVLNAWGPGKFDAELILDGQGFAPDGGTSATLIPPAFGMAGVNLHTWTGFGSVPYWNAFVANLEMRGRGNFFDPRFRDASQFPIAADAGFDRVINQPDLITSKLPALHLYQIALTAPTPPAGSFNPEAAQRGQAVFTGPARCAECHVPPLFTEPGWNLHPPAEIGIDDFQANRSPERGYRTTPLRGLFTREKGGFYHDGRFPTLDAVVNHYNQVLSLNLTSEQRADLVQYLRSL